MHRKICFFDWDGTLSADGDTVSPAVADALCRLRAAGHLAFLCSGRALSITAPGALALGFDGLVAGAGSYVVWGDEVLYRRQIERPALLRTVRHFLDTRQFLLLEGESVALAVNGGLIPGGDRFLQVTDPAQLDEGGQYADVVVTKFGARGFDERTRRLLEEDYHVIVNYNNINEMMCKGCCKADGIRRVLEACGARRADSVGFGDSYNDLDMLEYVGTAVAMGNAPEEVRALADFVTAPVTEDGVAVGLARLGLLAPADGCARGES